MNTEEIVNEVIKKLNENVIIKIEKNDNLNKPFYANKGDAGMDIRASEDVLIKPGETKLIKTNIKLSIPEGFQVEVRPRSGISLNTPLRVTNSPGTVDSGYKDEVGVIMHNTSLNGNETYTLNDKGNKQGSYLIKKDDRVAQMVLTRHYNIKFEEVDDVTDNSFDRGGGFGSSGIK